MQIARYRRSCQQVGKRLRRRPLSEPPVMRSLESLNEVEHLLAMSGHFHSAPFLSHLAGAVNHKGAALDAAHFLAVHVLHLHDTELSAQRLVRIGEELERESHLGLEVLM